MLGICAKKYLREFGGHDELLVVLITGQNDGLVSGIVVSVFVQFVLEIVLGTDSKSIVSAVFFGNFENAVSPVVGALWIFGIVDRVVSNDEWIFEILSQITGTVTNKTMAEMIEKKFSFRS